MPETQTGKYDSDFTALEEAYRWLQHINLRKHRGNHIVREQVQAARRALVLATDALLDADRKDG